MSIYILHCLLRPLDKTDQGMFVVLVRLRLGKPISKHDIFGNHIGLILNRKDHPLDKTVNLKEGFLNLIQIDAATEIVPLPVEPHAILRPVLSLPIFQSAHILEGFFGLLRFDQGLAVGIEPDEFQFFSASFRKFVVIEQSGPLLPYDSTIPVYKADGDHWYKKAVNPAI